MAEVNQVVNIPMEPMLKRYLAYVYQVNEANLYLPYSIKDPFAAYAISLLSTKESQQDYNAEYTALVPLNVGTSKRYLRYDHNKQLLQITAYNATLFNNHVYRKFIQDVFRSVMSLNSIGKPINKALEICLEFLGVIELCNVDSMLRQVHRIIKKNQQMHPTFCHSAEQAILTTSFYHHNVRDIKQH